MTSLLHGLRFLSPILACILFVGSLYSFFSTRQFLARGHRIRGSVVDINKFRGSGHVPLVSPTVEFDRPVDGRTVQHRLRIRSTRYYFRVGDMINLIVSADGSTVYVDDDRSVWLPTYLFFAGAIVSVMFTLAILKLRPTSGRLRQDTIR
jgi:hypothetical protein